MSASSHTVTVALAGNPNSGKTTVFNGLTGARQRIGNWPGVTVEKKEGFLSYDSATDLLVRPFAPEQGHTTEAHQATAQLAGGRINIMDLPGIYSLSATAEDEIIARDYLLSGDADVVVDVVDATNLQRNLYLTLQLIEMEIPVVVVLNMMDLAHQRGLHVDADELSERLGCPVVPASAIRSDSIHNIKRTIAQAAQAPTAATVRVSYPEPIETLLADWEPRLAEVAETLHVHPRWIALKILEHDSWITDRVVASGALGLREIADSLEALDKQLGDDADIAIADAKYALIHGLSRQVSKQRMTKEALSDRIDRIALNRVLGIPIFLGVMYLVFWVAITVGGAFIDFFDILFGTIFVDGLGALIASAGAPTWLQTIVAGGLGAGVQTVATFIPVMFFMFLMLALLEDSGYMARAAFVMDRFMRRIGLPGKSFVPMMVGFGCTVPAILGTRTLESTRDRYMTIFMAPFMSCGARLPVYALFAAAFFPTQGGLVVFSLYLIGIILAMLTGLLLKHTMFRGESSHFIMELPPYHTPRAKQTFLQTWSRLKSFIIRAGAVIVLVVMVLSVINSVGTDGTFGNEDSEQSVLSATGRAITPVFTPMGIEKDNWPATVGIFTGLFAKEIIVGTLGSLYTQSEPAAAPAPEGEAASAAEAGAGTGAEAGVPEAAAGSQAQGEAAATPSVDIGAGVLEALRSIPANLAGVLGGLVDPLGAGIISEEPDVVAEEAGAGSGIFARMRNRFTPLAAYAFLLFVLIYTPCLAAVGTAVQEMGGFLGTLLVIYQALLAWIVATLVFQIGSGGSIALIGLAAAILVAMGVGLRLLSRPVARIMTPEAQRK